MKCLLFAIIHYGKLLPSQEDWRDCIKEECAWWEHDLGRCSIVSIAWRLYAIVAVLRDVLDMIGKGGKLNGRSKTG